jgi:hypothetical protein
MTRATEHSLDLRRIREKSEKRRRQAKGSDRHELGFLLGAWILESGQRAPAAGRELPTQTPPYVNHNL